MKRTLIMIMALSIVAMFSYGCDTGGSSSGGGGVCGEAVRVANTSAARLFYPCNISGRVGATTTTSGYLGTYQSVNWLNTRVAQAGFVVLSFTPTNQYGTVTGWRAAHKSAIAKLQELSNSGNLAGKIDTTKLGTCGHSKGGGGSLWAASELGGSLRTCVGMAPYNGYPGTYEGPAPGIISKISAATMIQAGSGDTLATNAMTKGEYNALGNISKKYYEILGFNHMSWASAMGTNADRAANDIIAWMRYYMYGDAAAKGSIANQSGSRNFQWVDKGSTGSGGGSLPSGERASFVTAGNLALDVWEWGTTNGTNIAAYDFWATSTEGDAQKFVLKQVNGGFEIVPMIAANMRIDIPNASTVAGENVQIWESTGHNCQKFTFPSANGGVQIKNVNSGMCLTVSGSNVIQNPCNSSDPNQVFQKKRW